ncbi:hypothetical protein PTRA_a1543 [Pseudoalteromonas translucida KMM 520]|uniref:Uncharacterized protein n=1 Tax=Pseudoalteromonas translucida KMM 520 TaxID=1315283 RepID=A0A0U2VGZ7_9GAMM|nr:hypothetical protein [Pseudoalteromonas translucida]ALS32741.1 hypothetical protein PTRA_a1543 [Pseudoalteromonas translucida KMM 520]
MLKIIGWVLGIVAIGFVGMYFDKGEFLAGFVCVLAIGFLIPPLLNKINKNSKESAEKKGKEYKELTPKSSIIGGVVLLIIAAIMGNGSSNNEQVALPSWYDSSATELVSKKASDWHKATDSQKLSASADIIYTVWKDGKLKPKISNKIKSVDDIKPFANGLAKELDKAFDGSPSETGANPAIKEGAVTLLVLNGWI